MSEAVVDDCFKIDLSDESQYADYKRVSHVLLYAKTKKTGVQNLPRTAIVLMQMRFDGLIGFPGGEVEDGENPVDAVNRECLEEIDWRGNVTADNLLAVHAHPKQHLLTYFFGKELSEDAINTVIQDSVNSRDFGYESNGSIIVPLYTMADSFRGFPAFLTNSFIGRARSQLTDGLIALGILSEDSVKKALEAKDPGLIDRSKN